MVLQSVLYIVTYK